MGFWVLAVLGEGGGHTCMGSRGGACHWQKGGQAGLCSRGWQQNRTVCMDSLDGGVG